MSARDVAPATPHAAGAAELQAEIRRLTEANRESRSYENEREILRLRYLEGLRILEERDGSTPEHPSPAVDALPAGAPLPDLRLADVTPQVLRAGILRDGCLLVRGLVDSGRAESFGAEIDRAFAERERHDTDGSGDPAYYEPFRPDAGFEVPARPWIKEGGGVLAADSPRLCFEMIEMFGAAGVPDLVRDYLGEPVAISVHKTTLRKAEPQVVGAWHQDGAFMGDVRSLNLWLSLSRCGDVAPGLDMVPRRLDHFVETGTEGTVLPNQISQAKAEEAAGDLEIVRPVFEPGDAVFFDDLFLHQTGSDASMPKPRFAIESWFFGASAFPPDYAPIAV